MIDAVLIGVAEACMNFLEPLAKSYKGSNLLSYPVKDLRRLLDQYQDNAFYMSIKRLEQKGFIVFSYKDGIKKIKITKKGILKFKDLAIESIEIKKPKKWNGRWKVVIFDIPNSKKRIRDLLRERLKLLGFYSLQESVFIHPYASIKDIELIRDFYNIRAYVKIVSTDFFEIDDKIKNHFDL